MEDTGSAQGRPSSPVRVLLVDDQPRVLRALAALLDTYADLTVVGEAHDGAEAIAQVERTRPDVVLMDVVMPGLGGLEATRCLKRRFDVRVLLFTLHPSMQQEALAAGADGFFLKGGPTGDMVAALRRLGARRRSPVGEGSVAWRAS